MASFVKVLFFISLLMMGCKKENRQSNIRSSDTVDIKPESFMKVVDRSNTAGFDDERRKMDSLQKLSIVVIDSVSRLVWLKKDFSALNSRFVKSWDEAMQWKDQLNKERYLGFDDWYVPSIKEYKTLNQNSSDRKSYRENFIEIDQTYSWGKGAYAFWASNEINKYVASYISFHDGFATSGDKTVQKNSLTGEDFGMSARVVRKLKNL